MQNWMKIFIKFPKISKKDPKISKKEGSFFTISGLN